MSLGTTEAADLPLDPRPNAAATYAHPVPTIAADDAGARSVDWPAVRLHVVTGKGGTGKTTMAASLALALATGGKRVLVVEVEAGSRGENPRPFAFPLLALAALTRPDGLLLVACAAAVTTIHQVACGRLDRGCWR